MSKILELEWMNLTEKLPKTVLEVWWPTISSKICDPSRSAHNCEYLERKFQELSYFKKSIQNIQAFVIALFFQYLNYDPKENDFHRKNMENFKEFAKEANASEETALYKAVINLLEAASIYSTEEHKTEGAYGEEDIHYFIDLDMLALAREPDNYLQHADDIAKEYAFLDEKSYKNLRQRVLRSFLLIPNIFATKFFRDKYEVQARQNIQNELHRLS